MMQNWALWLYGSWNLLVAIYYGTDKVIARQNDGTRRHATRRGAGRRISESQLFWMAALFGAAGALIAMLLFRHKIRKWPFVVAVPLLLITQLALVWFLR